MTSDTTPVEAPSRLMPHPETADLRLPTVLFALSDPARLDLVRLLAADGPQSVGQCHVVDPSAPKSTFSHHLRTLRESGVVRNDPAGRQRCITLRRADLDARFPGLLDAVLAG